MPASAAVKETSKPQCAVHHDRDEQEREVQERVQVDGARHRTATYCSTPKKSERVSDEESSEDDRRREVDITEATDDEEQERERKQARRVREDVPRGRLVAANDRQHRNAGALVVVANEERERPEVRGRPEKDDREEEPSREIE